MPTRRGKLEARGESHLHYRGLTLPAAQMHHRVTREPGNLIHDLNADANAGMAARGQVEFVAVIMGTVGCLTSLTGCLVQLMQK
jgi:hypothetical protein